MGYSGQGLSSVKNNISQRTSAKRKSKLNGINTPAFHQGLEISDHTQKRMDLANQKRIWKTRRDLFLFLMVFLITWLVASR